MERSENTHFIDYIVGGMRRTALDLEKFQLQVGLGKAEALDKFDEMKKSYRQYVHELKVKVEDGKDKLISIQATLQDLQVQFALGKAVSIEAFNEQKKKILLAIHEVQVILKSKPILVKSYALLLEALENIKLKLEILSDKLEPVRVKTAEIYKDRKKDLEKIINSFKKNVDEKSDISNRMEIFQNELALAFSHFRKAFLSS